MILLLVIQVKQKKIFKETIDLIKKIGFINSYSFIFSPRPGTPAANKKLNKFEINKKRLKKFTKIIRKFTIKNNKKYLR